MSIELRASGFFEWHDKVKAQPGLGVESNRVAACMAHYRDHDFLGLFGSPSFGFDQVDMDFLAQASNVRWLHFWDVKVKRLDALHELHDLEEFSINPKRPGVDFACFPRLKTVVSHWNKADRGLTGSTIADYHLWRYQPSTKSFQGLEMPAALQRLELNWAGPSSLAGLPVMQHLKELQIHRSRNMSDLSELPRIAPALETLVTTTSSKIDPTAGVLDHPTLKLALVDGRRIIDRRG